MFYPATLPENYGVFMNSNEPPVILIVDDTPANVQLLTQILNHDYKIITASNGEDALKIAQHELPDLILLDVKMPRMNGFEVFRWLKKNPYTSKIIVIFVTSMKNGTDEEMGLNLGAADYITKPFMVPIIKARIHNNILLKQEADLMASLALIDALTMIPNRRCFDETLISEWGRAMNDGTSLSLALINIDYFQKYNDYYGYGAGDICLKILSAALTKRLDRPGDFIARYVDDEFMVLLPDTDQDMAWQIAEELRIGIEALGLAHSYPDAGSVVTMSVGVTTQRVISKSLFPKILCDAAMEALYLAKKGGRNQVCRGYVRG